MDKNKIKEPEAQAEKIVKPTHRYVCDACTGVAGTSSIPVEVKALNCQSCGKFQQCKAENWIKI